MASHLRCNPVRGWIWGNRLAAKRGRGAQEEEDGGWGEAGEVVLLVGRTDGRLTVTVTDTDTRGLVSVSSVLVNRLFLSKVIIPARRVIIVNGQPTTTTTTTTAQFSCTL